MYNEEENEVMKISAAQNNGLRKPSIGTTRSGLDVFKSSLSHLNDRSTSKDVENLLNVLGTLKEDDQHRALEMLETLSDQSKIVLTDRVMTALKGCNNPKSSLELLLPVLKLSSSMDKFTPNGGKVTTTPLGTLLINLQYSSGLSNDKKCDLVSTVLNHVMETGQLESFIQTNQENKALPSLMNAACFESLRPAFNNLGLV